MTKFLKQLIFVTIGCFFAIPVFAQSTSHARKASHSGVSSLSAERSKILCKAWRLDSTSEFGVVNKATAKEANDGITFITDGSLFITQEGVASTGTWTYSGGRINTATKNPDNKLSFRLLALQDNRLVLEYQYPAPDLSRIQYIYSPKK